MVGAIDYWKGYKNLEPVEDEGTVVRELLKIMVEARKMAIEEKRFEYADLVKNSFIKLGYQIRDLPDGTSELVVIL